MKKKELYPNIYLVEFPTSREAAMTFMRFQEHYESPKFRNKIFTREQYINWYSKGYSKPFTYYTDWSGFNIPSYVLLPFFSGAFKDFTSREREFLNLFRECTGQYYIIGIQKGNKNTLKHELMHALYYTTPEYKNSVDTILCSGPTNAKIYKYLTKIGYCKEVLEDETHAYLATCMDRLQDAKINLKPYSNIIYRLHRNYKKYIKKSY